MNRIATKSEIFDAEPPSDVSRTSRPVITALQVSALLILMVFLIPLALLWGGGPLLWLLVMLYALVAFSLFTDAKTIERNTVRMIPELFHPSAVTNVMEVQVALERNGVRIFKGRLRSSAGAAYEALKRSLSPAETPLVQEDDDSDAAIVLVPGEAERKDMREQHTWVNWFLFILTFITTTWAGALHQRLSPEDPFRIATGLPYSIGLLAILGLHEMGHYLTARRHGMSVTPPYFIPIPFALGTFGAFIKLRSAPENRKALFDVAVAGPLAGLAIAIPALLIGLRQSVIIPPSYPENVLSGTFVNSSILFTLISRLSLGVDFPEGCMLQLSPLAFAGWLGLLVTALNLIPVGQLDGGHIAHAMFGRRFGDLIGRVAMGTLFLLALFVWPGLMLWALIVFFIAGRTAPPLNDITRISLGRKLLGYIAFIIFLSIILPMPHLFLPASSLRCPYL